MTCPALSVKVLKKDYIIRKNQVEHTKTERSVLGYVHHPFIVGLTMAFQVRTGTGTGTGTENYHHFEQCTVLYCHDVM